MVKRAFSILVVTVVLGIVLRGICLSGITRAATGIVKIVEDRLPYGEITATGTGYPPKREVSPAQKRLLAQRAATVDAYRTLAAMLSGISGYVAEGGEGYIQASGYIRGAAVTQVREFADGKVEVDLSLPVSLKGKEGGKRITWDKVIADISGKGYPVYYLRRSGRQISEEEWLELIEKEEL